MASEGLFTPELSAVVALEQDDAGEKTDTFEENIDFIEDENLDLMVAENIDVIDEENKIVPEIEENREVPEPDGGGTDKEVITNDGVQEARLFQLPLTRIRNLMKLDPDMHIASNEAVFVITRSTELFIESLAREAFSFTVQSKKKTLQKRDVDLAISSVDSLMFLDGAMNF
ncbi:DNA polymerase epsilon subunit 4 [Eurosta solidaginis]|uniref:DNA polymerase epsilon subunit 4 n=1 Tax=Eurosta solidaginis TaxID=178769 RepID=UPI0035307C7D